MPFRILLVDDEKGITETLTAILQMKGYVVFAAGDGTEGYELACRLKPDLIISDITMPRLNGVEMAIALTKILGEVKVLLISGQAVTVKSLEQARSQGYDFAWLAKPVHPLDLLSQVEAMLSPDSADEAGRPTTSPSPE